MKSQLQIRLVALASLALPATRLSAGVIAPIGLAPGSPYQLIFVTADSTNAESVSINGYNAFVQEEAAISSSPVVQGATWTAVASVSITSASANAPSTGTYPIYNTAGQLVEPIGTSLYGSTLVNLVDYDQFGNLADFQAVWTGTDPTGLADPTEPLGTSYPIVGYTAYGTSGNKPGQWLDTTFTNSFNTLPLYALSSPIISPVPEPSTIALFCSGLLGLWAVYPRRRATAACGG